MRPGDLLRASGAYDRSAILRLAHGEYRAAGGRKAWGDVLHWAWGQAKTQRRQRAAGAVDERLRDMLAHRIERNAEKRHASPLWI